MTDWQRVSKVIAEEAAQDREITIVDDSDAGLSEHVREAVERAVQLLSEGRVTEAQALLAEHGLDMSVGRVLRGKVEPIAELESR